MTTPVSLLLPPEILAPLIAEVVRTTIVEIEAARAALPDNRLAWTEGESAALLGLRCHQLRDERLRKRISASVGPGGKILYSRQDLLNYLQARRWEGTKE